MRDRGDRLLINTNPPIAEENLLGGAFLYEHSAGGGKFWGFYSENDDFVKENRVGAV